MANIKLDSKRMSGRKVNEDKHSELLKVLNKMTMNKRFKNLRGDVTVDSVLIALEYYDEVRVRKDDVYIRICKPVNGKYVWYVNADQYGFNADDVKQRFMTTVKKVMIEFKFVFFLIWLLYLIQI